VVVGCGDWVLLFDFFPGGCPWVVAGCCLFFIFVEFKVSGKEEVLIVLHSNSIHN
jgi:membrane-bound ClpP family serine protease